MRPLCRLLALALLASAAPALSPKLALRQYSHTVWTDAAGQPLPALQAFAQTHDGFLWLVTHSGHLRFDGLRFAEWTLAPGNRLPAGVAHDLLIARDGAAWLATPSGLSRVHNGRVTSYPLPWTRAAINGMLEDHAGLIWTAVEIDGESFLQSFSLADGVARRHGHSDGAPATVRAVAADGDALWIGTDAAVCRWSPGATPSCRTLPGPVEALAPAGAGVVYAASAAAIHRIAAGRVEPVLPKVAAPITIRRHMLLVDRHGSLWAGTTHGLLRVRNEDVETFGRKDGLSGEFVLGMLEDAEGDVWVATNNGLDRFREPRVTHYSTADGLSGEYVTAVAPSRDGSVWVGTFGNGLNRIQDGAVSRYSTADGLPSNNLTAIEEDAAGRVWVACEARIAVLMGNRFVETPVPSRQPVYDLASDQRGAIWAAANALWRFSGGRSAEAITAGQPEDTIRVMASRAGPIWLGSFTAGIATLAGPRAAAAPVDGLKGAPRAMIEDSSGAVWIAAGSTLNRVREGKLTTWGPTQGLAAAEIYGITLDRRGDLWLATESAVLRVALSDLEKSPDGSPIPARFLRYDEKDGLRPADRVDLYSPRIATAADGRIWLRERDGVGVIDPETLGANGVPPPVMIEQLTADGVALFDNQPRFRARQLQIAYTANSLMAPERVRFRYMLQDVPAFWLDAQGRREVTYVDLPPGVYRFRVTACNLDDFCNEKGAAADFVVIPFYYQTVWFKFVASAAVWIVIWGAYKLRMRRVESRYRLVARDRARVTREIHDSLLQGFAGVVLQLDAASRLFQSNPAASKERLDRALDQADESLREARLMLSDLRLPILEGRTLSEALADAGETVTRGTSIGFSLKVRGNERTLSYGAQVALYLIGREAMRNAASHASPGRISVTVTYEDRRCGVRVQDDGCGFDLATARQKEGHLGVRGMSERAREAGADFHIETAAGVGTTVEVIVPYKSGAGGTPM